MRVPLHWLLSVFVIATNICLAADDPVPSGAKQKAKQVNSLLKSYLRAGSHIGHRQRIVDEAVALGSPFTGALRTMIGRRGASDLLKYRSQFTVRIGSARNITAAGVVAQSNELAVRRQELIRASQFALQLEQRLADDGPIEDGSDPDDEAMGESRFEQQLKKTEAELILQWLLNKGYGRLNSAEAALAAEANRLRAQQKLAPLEVDFKLSAVARDHSLDMNRLRFLSHASKLPGKETFSDRARRFGTTAAAENIANCSSAAEAMSRWMASSGHRRNILGASIRRVGVGRVGRKFTMMLGQ